MNRSIIDLKKWRPREELYIALSDLDFSWYPEEVKQIIRLWRYGWHITDIAEQMERDPDEVVILIMDLARQKIIKPRKGGVFGKAVYSK